MNYLSFMLSCNTKQLAANELPTISGQSEGELDTDSTKTDNLTKFVHPLSISEDEEDDEGSEKCDTTKDDDSGLETEHECRKPEGKTAATTTSSTNNKYVCGFFITKIYKTFNIIYVFVFCIKIHLAY